jgi:hypothetical protein
VLDVYLYIVVFPLVRGFSAYLHTYKCTIYVAFSPSGILEPVCLGFWWLSIKISRLDETNGVASLRPFPKPIDKLHRREEAPQGASRGFPQL